MRVELRMYEGLSPAAWWPLSLSPGHSQKAQIVDREVIDINVLSSLAGPESRQEVAVVGVITASVMK